MVQPIVADIDQRLGNRIRDLRAERGLTLDGLAEAARVSRAMLSRIERGESSPTAQLLNRVCDGLGITLSALFAEPSPAPSPLARYKDQPTWRDPATRYIRRSVSPAGTGSPIDIVEIELPPGARVAFDSRQVGRDKHVWVLDGTLQLHVGEAQYRLERGDCLMMHSAHQTVFENPTRRTVRYALVALNGTTR